MYQVGFSNEAFQQFLIQHVKRRLSGSSVMAVDEIENIRQSVLFVMDHGLEGRTVEERFNSGKRVLNAKLAVVEEIYQKLSDTYERFGIESMKDTLEELGKFFTTYDIEYSATASGSAWIDYQLANSVDDLQYKGIDFVEEYLRRLTVENEFVTQIPKEQVRELLRVYTRKLGYDNRKDINNLYQVVFDQWIAKGIAGSARTTLLVTEPEAEYVYSCIQRGNVPDEVMHLLADQPYHRQTFQRFIQRMHSLDSAASLKNALLIEEKEQMALTLTPAMTAADFTQLIESYQLLEDEAEQTIFLLEKIVSPYDLFEFLEQESVPEIFYQQMSFEQGLGLLLVVNQYQEGMLENWEDVLSLPNEGLRGFVEGLEESQKTMITATFQQFTIGERDFS